MLTPNDKMGTYRGKALYRRFYVDRQYDCNSVGLINS